MNSHHPIKKKHGPIPHDPRNEPLPEGDHEGRSREGKEARLEEGVEMKGSERKYPSGENAVGPRKESAETEDEYGLPTGIRRATPANSDRRAGSSDAEDVEQRGKGRNVKPGTTGPGS
jgi:hypothetical protein